MDVQKPEQEQPKNKPPVEQGDRLVGDADEAAEWAKAFGAEPEEPKPIPTPPVQPKR